MAFVCSVMVLRLSVVLVVLQVLYDCVLSVITMVIKVRL